MDTIHEMLSPNAIQAAITSHPGELVLMVQPTEASCGVLDRRGHIYVRSCHLTLGVLAPDTSKFNLSLADQVPTTCFVVDGGSRINRPWMPFYPDSYPLYTQLLTEVWYHSVSERAISPRETSLTIIAGDEAVVDYFDVPAATRRNQPNRDLRTLAKLARQLDYPVPSIVDFESSHRSLTSELTDELWELVIELSATPNSERKDAISAALPRLARLMGALRDGGCGDHPFVGVAAHLYGL